MTDDRTELGANAEDSRSAGSNVRRVIESLDAKFPGMYARLVRDNKLVPAIAVSIDGAVTALGLLGKIGPDSEVHIVPAISGG